MRITNIEPYLVGLELKIPFRFAYGTFRVVPRVFVRLETDAIGDGGFAWGEAAIDFPFIDYDMYDVYDAIRKSTASIVGSDLNERGDLLLSPFLDVAPAARCALNMAADDALGRVRGISSAELYGVKREPGAALRSLGFDESGRIDTWANVQGIPKIKLGQGVPADINALTVAEQLSVQTKRRYAVDFNASYSIEQIRLFIQQLQDIGCSCANCIMWEQPLEPSVPISDWEQLVQLIKFSGLNLILVADESFITAEAGRDLVRIGVGLNYKIQKFGGILAAVDLEAQIDRPMQSFIGGTIPSPLGRAYDRLASRVLVSANLPGDGTSDANEYLSRRCGAA